ncbi:MAG: CoA transferase [Thermodesulfobacteriota bacterium]|nr:CoA transferase [Thermodesulfobacteriota bacterium]
MIMPLMGIRVLECAAWHNGPAAGYMLGDLGADVIKIEEPERGDATRGVSALWGTPMMFQGRVLLSELTNRNKRGITLNLKTQKGKEILYRLVEKADVFITNYSKRVIDDLKFDYDTLKHYNQKLIYAINYGYGSKGIWATKRAFDPIAQALSGAMWAAGDRDSHEPTQLMGGYFDQLGATMLAYGILAALVVRERQGIGQVVETSLLAGAIHQQAMAVTAVLMMERVIARHSQKRARQPLANHYRCADNKWILIAEIQSDRYWKDFCQAIEHPDLEKDERFNDVSKRRANYAELIRILDDVFVTKTRDEWVTKFLKESWEFAFAPVYDFAEAAKSEPVLANEYVVEFDHPAFGKTKQVNCPVKFSESETGIKHEAPELGQHTEEVLLEMDFSWDDISQLRAEGII